MILLGVIKRKRWTNSLEFTANDNETTLPDCSLTPPNLRGTTLSRKDIPTSPYNKGENNNYNHIGESNNNNNHIGENNNNIVSSLAQ